MKRKTQGKRTLGGLLALAVSAMDFMLTARAGDIGSSTVVTGTKKLVSDVTTVLAVLSLSVGGAAMAYFLIRKAMADETDGKMWQKRAVTALICGIGGALASGIVSMIAAYYGK